MNASTQARILAVVGLAAVALFGAAASIAHASRKNTRLRTM
jgi:hypothetical protein